MNIVMTKEALIEHLSKQLKAAQAEDARLKKQHEIAESKLLASFRENMRLAMKWDYKALKKHGFGVSAGKYGERPSCPKSEASAIDRELRSAKLDTRTSTFTIAPKTDLYNAVTWMPVALRLSETMCD